MTQKMSENLFKSSISDFLIKDVTEQLGKKKQPMPEELSMKVSSKSDVAKLNSSIQAIKPHIPENLYNSMTHELNEISEDQREAATKRGKYIMDINEWAQSFYPEFRAIKEFEDAYIGGHIKEMVVFISGKVHSQESYDKLVEYVKSKKPPYEVLAKVDIGAGSASPCVS